jgi:hypothetical protein
MRNVITHQRVDAFNMAISRDPICRNVSRRKNKYCFSSQPVVGHAQPPSIDWPGCFFLFWPAPTVLLKVSIHCLGRRTVGSNLSLTRTATNYGNEERKAVVCLVPYSPTSQRDHFGNICQAARYRSWWWWWFSRNGPPDRFSCTAGSRHSSCTWLCETRLCRFVFTGNSPFVDDYYRAGYMG